jgi:DNA repair protein RecN (Recombination protein N)
LSVRFIPLNLTFVYFFKLLTRLHIQNYALIKRLEVGFEPSFNIITGETGAGKSIMLGAMALLKGERADVKALFNTEEKCLIEAEFNVKALEIEHLFEENDLSFEQDCIIRREIAPTGRSRAFVNDTPVTLDILSQITNKLLDIHSQHDTLLLENSTYQLDIIDTYAENQSIKKTFTELFVKYAHLKKELDELENLNNSSLKSNDFDSFLLKELIEAKLEANEEELVKTELVKIENAEEIKTKLNTVKLQLDDQQYGIVGNLKAAAASLDKIAIYDQDIRQIKDRVLSCYEELKDVLAEVESKEEAVNIDEEKAELIRQRLDLVYSLQTKHRVSSTNELLAIAENLQNKLSTFANLEEKIEALKLDVAHAHTQMMLKAEELSQSRLSKTKDLANELEGLLKNISINNAVIEISHQLVTPNKSGIDQFDILFSANKGIKPQKLKSVASGGEFSRLMLCIKYILASKKSLPTIIFDEIDTGVSGDVALKMAQMMKAMSNKHQVLTITHLPQIAAFGKKHFYVYKDDSEAFTSSNIKVLNPAERVDQLAEMIGGKNPTPMAQASAKELLDTYSN